MSEEPEERPTLPSLEEQARSHPPTQAQVDAFLAWSRAEHAQASRVPAPLSTRPLPPLPPEPQGFLAWVGHNQGLIFIVFLLLAVDILLILLVLGVH